MVTLPSTGPSISRWAQLQGMVAGSLDESETERLQDGVEGLELLVVDVAEDRHVIDRVGPPPTRLLPGDVIEDLRAYASASMSRRSATLGRHPATLRRLGRGNGDAAALRHRAVGELDEQLAVGGVLGQHQAIEVEVFRVVRGGDPG